MKLDNKTIYEAVHKWIENQSLAESIYGHISSWDTSEVTSMNGLFMSASNFNDDIGDWNTSKVENMSEMFREATLFNQDIGGWDVSSVDDMSLMFTDAESFNQNIGGWDVSNVTDMLEMFNGAESFNQNIGGWDVSNVTRMCDVYEAGMFTHAKSFNQDIGNWDISKITDLTAMFYGAENFNQNLKNWDVSNVKYFTVIFHESNMPSELKDSNENETLPDWVHKYFTKYIPEEKFTCKILKCRNMEFREYNELLFLESLCNETINIYVIETLNGGADGFNIYKGGQFEDDFSQELWNYINDTDEGHNFINGFFTHTINKLGVDFSFYDKDRSSIIEGIEFEIKK